MKVRLKASRSLRLGAAGTCALLFLFWSLWTSVDYLAEQEGKIQTLLSQNERLREHLSTEHAEKVRLENATIHPHFSTPPADVLAPPPPPPMIVENSQALEDNAGFAYVFYATDPTYACSVLVNIDRLQNVLHARVPIHVLVTSDISESYIRTMEAMNATVHLREAPPLAQDSAYYYRGSLLKLLAFEMHIISPGLKRVLVFDSDQLIMKNLDSLFTGLPPNDLAAPRAYWLSKDFLASTFMMIDLSDRLWQSVRHALDTLAKDKFDMDIVNELLGDTVLMLGGEYVTLNSHWETWNLPKWFHTELNVTVQPTEAASPPSVEAVSPQPAEGDGSQPAETAQPGEGDGSQLAETAQPEEGGPQPTEGGDPQPVEGDRPQPVEGDSSQPVEGDSPQPVEGDSPSSVEGDNQEPAVTAQPANGASEEALQAANKPPATEPSEPPRDDELSNGGESGTAAVLDSISPSVDASPQLPEAAGDQSSQNEAVAGGQGETVATAESSLSSADGNPQAAGEESDAQPWKYELGARGAGGATAAPESSDASRIRMTRAEGDQDSSSELVGKNDMSNDGNTTTTTSKASPAPESITTSDPATEPATPPSNTTTPPTRTTPSAPDFASTYPSSPPSSSSAPPTPSATEVYPPPVPKYPSTHPLYIELARLQEAASVIHFTALGKPWTWAGYEVQQERPSAHPLMAEQFEIWRAAAARVCPSGLPRPSY
ncbi:hypothetical protein BDY17DRAFT_309097 [Neohortaea acidophila]|uniref:Nucleotide-diphospho-sugar transferase n=1 Tax=Neohortaea acidophila TaxID=245834 RepID=A0A6A6Q007_9PEZI|nr:uncharacterized protein BDY17DRAFT_309097 [Neohortaea acidophila]KAF2485798.1 hypothetical protein BDY17DRAFT_309097 [Neohortaea acidophila]